MQVVELWIRRPCFGKRMSQDSVLYQVCWKHFPDVVHEQLPPRIQQVFDLVRPWSCCFPNSTRPDLNPLLNFLLSCLTQGAPIISRLSPRWETQLSRSILLFLFGNRLHFRSRSASHLSSDRHCVVISLLVQRPIQGRPSSSGKSPPFTHISSISAREVYTPSPAFAGSHCPTNAAAAVTGGRLFAISASTVRQTFSCFCIDRGAALHPLDKWTLSPQR